VNGIGDERIHFHNLDQNVGEQSGPNNHGLGLAQGSLVAFLNHDDLWYPDHLERLLEAMTSNKADLVFSPVQNIDPRRGAHYFGWFSGGIYHPGSCVPASSWLFRRELADRVGPWRFYREIYNIPSQDWLFRAWKMGLRLHGTQVPGVMAFGSESRPGCYSQRHEHEQRTWLERMDRDPGLRDGLIKAHVDARSWRRLLKPLRWPELGDRFLRWAIMKAKRMYALATRRDPKHVLAWLQGQKAGHFIDRLRRIRGIDKP